MKERRLYTYLPEENTADVDGILSTALAPHGWEKYRQYLGLPEDADKEAVLRGLEEWEKGRSKAISILSEPISEEAPDVVKDFAQSHVLYSMPSYEELLKRKLVERLYRVMRHGPGTRLVNRVNHRKIDWTTTAPTSGGPKLNGVPHYLMVTTKGKIPASLVRREERFVK